MRASTPVTAPSPDSQSPPAPPTPSKSSPPPDSAPPPSTPAVAPPPADESPETPPPSTSPASPPPSSSPPPPEKSAPPPSDDNGDSPSTPPPSSSPSPPSPSQSASPPSPPQSSTPPSPPRSSSPPSPPQSSSPPSPPKSSSPSSPSITPPPPASSSVPTPPSPSGSTSSLAPPPPSRTRHAPPSHSRSSTKTESPNNSSSLPVPVIASIAASVAAVLILLLSVLIFCCTKKKKKRPPGSMHYYGDPSHGGRKGDYYNGGPHQSWHGPPPPMDHIVKMGQQGGGGPPSSGGPWPPLPPPPPPMMSSGDMSSNYSGPRANPLPPPSPNIALGFNKSTFTYEELAAATNGFSQANLLGQGGFGYVHKGMLPNGKEVAVKSLKSGSGQGEREFQAEVEIISRVHHRHLVSLVGYCISDRQRMLVYEFVPNKTLEYHLHGKGCPTMDWPTRLRIALGAAKGLAYLHEDCHPRIIHRDIKTANILLDYKFEAMVADFGLAKLSSDNYTHVSTRVMGTFGYLAPEYASSGKLTDKSDVFSFGVMLLELITGRRPVDTTNQYMEDSLVDWARPLLTQALEDGNCDEVVDPHLENNYNPNEMMRLVACAAASVRHSAKRRPKMSQIVRALEGDSSLEDLNEGIKPGQSSMFGSSQGSSDYEAGQYNADMRRFKRMALASKELGSNEYSGPTSEYGLNPSPSSSEGPHSREMDPNSNRRRSPNHY